MKCSRLQ